MAALVTIVPVFFCSLLSSYQNKQATHNVYFSDVSDGKSGTENMLSRSGQFQFSLSHICNVIFAFLLLKVVDGTSRTTPFHHALL